MARYTVFTPRQRRLLVGLIAAAGWFSTLSSFIYYPALSLLAHDLHTTVERINLTVAAYLAVSGAAPSIAGDAADMFGRKPVYMITLSMYFCANLGIALQRSFVALLLLRMLQSAGISGTYSVAYGVIADIATPGERGAYVGAVSFGITTAPSLGPLLGGALAYGPGWRWIFWFLTIASAAVLISMLFLLPETARSVVGNGSIAPPVRWRPWIPQIMRPWKHEEPDHGTILHTSKGIPNPIKALIILARKDTALVVFGGGILYMIYCASHTSLATVCIKTYSLNQLEAGLVYLPYGLASLLSTFVSGKLIDRDYRITAAKYDFPVNKVEGDDLTKFPVEEARLRGVFIHILIAIGAIIGYGWTVDRHVHLSVPLILQFIAGFSIQTCFNIKNTLLIDINHKAPATAQAASNIVRCALAAVATGVIDYMIRDIGFGWTFTVFGGFAGLTAIMYCIEYKRGMRWRVPQVLETSPDGHSQADCEAKPSLNTNAHEQAV